jgi:hypothetical protein
VRSRGCPPYDTRNELTECRHLLHLAGACCERVFD